MSYRVPTSAEEYNRDNDQAARSALATQIEDVERVTKRIQTSDGTISLGDGTLTLANGSNNNVAAGYDTYMQVSGPTAAFSITGIVPVRGAGNTAQRGAIGRWLVLRNPTAYTMTIAHQSGSSSAANRIITSTAADVELAAGTTAMLIYNAAAARWHLVDMVALALTLTTLTVANEGLHLLDTNASHDLIIKPGSDLTADRTLTLTTGDSNRTVTLNGDTTLSGTNTGDEPSATAAAEGVVELATVDEASTGTDTTRVVTPAGLDEYFRDRMAGNVFWHGGTSPPTGSLLCDGSAVSRTTYARLFAAIGTAHGEGDGSTTFNLPDIEGRFIRGRDNGAGRDPDAAGRSAAATGGNSGDAVGSVQNDEFEAHTHGLNTQSNAPATGGTIKVTGAGASTTTSAAGGSTETRPKNIYLLPCIWY